MWGLGSTNQSKNQSDKMTARMAVPGPWRRFPGLSATHIMSSLYAHAFSHQAAFRRLSFQHNLKRATYSSQRASLPSPLRTWHLRHHVTPSRVMATAGTGLAGAGLGLSLYANFQKLNCERESYLILVTNLV